MDTSASVDTYYRTKANPYFVKNNLLRTINSNFEKQQ